MIVGGAQENTLYTLRGHLEHGHDTVLLTGPTTGPEGNLLEKKPLPGLQVVLVPDLIRAIRPGRDYRAYRWLLKHFREARYDVVHTHSSKAGIVARIAARTAGIPVVVHTVHGQAFHRFLPWWRNRIYIAAERLAANYCDRIYAVAEAMIDQCVEAGVAPRSRYRTVYSGMELEPYLNGSRDRALAEALGIPETAPVVGKVARLFELKGYEDLVTAAPAIAKAVPEVRFLIVGDGLMRQQVEERFTALGLRQNVVFAGLVPPEEVPRYVSLMTVLVHLSLREGLPRTVVQALAAGKPAVGFALDGTPEAILDGRTGFLCAARDAAAVSAAVVKLLRSPQLCAEMGAAGREHVRTRWDWRHMVAVLEQDYGTLLSEKAEG